MKINSYLVNGGIKNFHAKNPFFLLLLLQYFDVINKKLIYLIVFLFYFVTDLLKDAINGDLQNYKRTISVKLDKTDLIIRRTVFLFFRVS